MASRAAPVNGSVTGGCGDMPDECLMTYCLLFTQSKSLLYNFIETSGGLYMNIPLSDGRRETYALNVAGGHSGADSARLAGYCPNNPQNARVMSWYLLKRQDVQNRIAQLREAASDKAILNLTQIRIILSQISRARLRDYYKDGVLRPLDDDTPNPSAVAEVTYKYDPTHRKPAPVSLRLRDPIQAISELCRLDGAYKQKPMVVQIAPITSVSVLESARAKLATKIERTGSGAIEDGDIGSRGEDRCSDVPLLAEHIDTKNSDKEVTHGTRKPRARGKTQIG